MEATMEHLIGLEVWSRSDADQADFIMCVTRSDSGVYRTWRESGFNEHHRMPVEDLISMLSAVQVDFSDLKAVCRGDGEFTLEAAAIKWSRRVLSGRTKAVMSEIGWEPRPPWRRLYAGKHNIQNWEPNARRHKAEMKVKKLEADIEKASKLDTSVMTDEQFAANRRRMIELKMERAKLQKHSQGGDNA